MEKVLSYKEMDALLRSARDESLFDGPAAAAPVERWDLRQAGLLGKEQLHSISQLHESFARNLTSGVSGYLRDKFEVALVAVEQLAYRDFLTRFPDVTYYGSFRLLPGDARGILHLDLTLVFPIVDILLGGPGTMPQATREVTDIEESVLEGIGRIVCHELRVVSEPLGIQFEYEGREPSSQMLRIMPPEEKTLILTFDITMTDSKGMLNIAFPSVVSSTLMRKLRADLVYQRSRGPAVNQETISQRLLQSRVRLELATPATPVRLMDLLTLRQGEILPLRCSIEAQAVLRMGGRECWSARAVGKRNTRAAQLEQPLAMPERED